jgi:hypothetical protein
MLIYLDRILGMTIGIQAKFCLSFAPRRTDIGVSLVCSYSGTCEDLIVYSGSFQVLLPGSSKLTLLSCCRTRQHLDGLLHCLRSHLPQVCSPCTSFDSSFCNRMATHVWFLPSYHSLCIFCETQIATLCADLSVYFIASHPPLALSLCPWIS